MITYSNLCVIECVTNVKIFFELPKCCLGMFLVLLDETGSDHFGNHGKCSDGYFGAIIKIGKNMNLSGSGSNDLIIDMCALRSVRYLMRLYSGYNRSCCHGGSLSLLLKSFLLNPFRGGGKHDLFYTFCSVLIILRKPSIALSTFIMVYGIMG